ncbi:MAG: hypothetical protein ACO1SV_14770 [Fimbriimonas sp.]
MKHWPLMLVGGCVAVTALYHSLVVTDTPAPLRGLPVERLPAAGEATYPPFLKGTHPQLFDVRADVATVRRRMKGYAVKENPARNGFVLTGPEGTFHLYPGVVWTYDRDPLSPGPALPTYKDRTIVVAEETPGFRDWLRGASRTIRKLVTGKDPNPPLMVGYYLDVDTYWPGVVL